MDILIMFFFAYKNLKLAEKSQENRWKWFFKTAFAWISFEIAGGFIFSKVVGLDLSKVEEWTQDSSVLLPLVLFGILAGYLGYLLVRRSLLSIQKNNH